MSLLENIKTPSDLKKLSVKELPAVAEEIRERIVSVCEDNGGHLASSLGAVDAIVALYYVFDFPKDKIIFDVGHQSYAHKILSGRNELFDTIRKECGLSGFPNIFESEYDAFTVGHAGTSLSAALGYCAARDKLKEDYYVVSFVGDGSFFNGENLEALFSSEKKPEKLLIILNDNGMSISPNIGGVSNHLDSLRTSKGYLSVKKFIKNKIATIPSVGKGIARGLADIKNDIKYSMMDYGGVLFEELGFTYFGPVDGHDITKLCDAFERAKMLNEPVLIHVITKKGKGYRNAEKAPGRFHGIEPFDPETGEVLNKPKRPTYSKLMGEHLVSLARKDERIVAITAAMGEATGLGAFAREFPDRYFDVGIAEQHAVTFAAGLAKEGMRPFVCIYSSFLQRAYDQMIHDVCMQKLPVTFMIDRAGVVGADGETHNGVFDLSYLNPMPNMTVLVPPYDKALTDCMDFALELDGPCAIRYPKGEVLEPVQNRVCGRMFSPAPKTAARIELIGIGRMAETAHEVCNVLSARGIQAVCEETVFAKPIEERFYKDIEPNTLIVTIEDNVVKGGFGEALRAQLDANQKIMNFGWPDTFIEQGTFKELTDKYGLSADTIAERICEALERKA